MRAFVLPALALSAAMAMPAFAQPAAAPSTSLGSLMGPAMFVSDIERSRHFYVDGIGLHLAAQFGDPHKYETILTFDPQGRNGVIILLTDQTAKVQAPVDHGHGYDRTVLKINDLAAVDARLTAAGFAHAPIRAGGQGARVMLLTDPDGYHLELVDAGSTAQGKAPQ